MSRISTVLGALSIARTYPRVRSTRVAPSGSLGTRCQVFVVSQEQVVLGGEVIDQPPLGHSRFVGDRIEGESGDAALLDHGKGGVNELGSSARSGHLGFLSRPR